MKINLHVVDRFVRIVVALAGIAAASFARLPMGARLAVGLVSIYVFASAIAGRCVGYRLLGLSTCPVSSSPGR